MPDSNNPNYIHENGRKCWYMGTAWQTLDGSTCNMDHWLHKTIPTPSGHHDDVERDDEVDATVDRGSFGMPTVGKAAACCLIPKPLSNRNFLYNLVVTRGQVDIGYGDEGEIIALPTPEAKRIMADLPDWLTRFLHKNTKYARAQKIDLGAKGIMPDVNRKASVLMDRIWYGAGEVDESTVEVIDDLIGHLLLLRDKVVYTDASEGD